MNFEEIETIKKLAIIALFSDDELMEKIVLKGGNALDMIYKIHSRASIDLDFSMSSEFDKNEFESVKYRINRALEKIFGEHGFMVFDFRFEEKPKICKSPKLPPPFWGGYEAEFKVIEKSKFSQLVNDPHKLRVSAADIGPGSKKKFRIDISKWEDCGHKSKRELDYYTIYLYTPEMIVCEKLRAICQQMPEYQKFIGSNTASARARDFFDIHATIKYFDIDILADENIKLLKSSFKAKEVPLEFLSHVCEYKEYHRPDFEQVRNTVKPNVKLKDYDYYFDYVFKICEKLIKALGIK